MHHLLNVPLPSCLLPRMPQQTFSSLKFQLKCPFFREGPWIFMRNPSLLSSVLPQPLALSLFPLCLVSGTHVFLDCGPPLPPEGRDGPPQLCHCSIWQGWHVEGGWRGTMASSKGGAQVLLTSGAGHLAPGNLSHPSAACFPPLRMSALSA